MKKLILSILTIIPFYIHAQPSDHEILHKLLHNSYKFYQLLRCENGLYYDFVSHVESSERGSTASIGMGLMAQCIGAEMGFNSNAEYEVIETLETVLGINDNKVFIERNKSNCFIHFFNVHTGESMSHDYSPIDTDLMIAGALFAKRYFHHNKLITKYADQLYEMVNHDVFIGDWEKGQIALEMKEDGTSKDAFTLPFNEYMLVAWMAKNHPRASSLDAKKLWNKYYETPDILPYASYITKVGEEIMVLTDLAVSKEFTSNFTFMFNYMFVHDFSISQKYNEAMRSAALADQTWWNEQDKLTALGKMPYEWGTTAGFGLRYTNSCVTEGYSVDKICEYKYIGTVKDKNRGKNIAPNALAGYSAVMPYQVRRDILAMYKDNRGLGKYTLPIKKGITDGHEYILWKYSYIDLNWKPSRVEGVDFACMLFGLAALPEFLGVDFFQQYNDYFNSDLPTYTRDN